MYFFTQKYHNSIWKTLLLGLIFVTFPLTIWAGLAPDKRRPTQRIRLAHPIKPQSINVFSHAAFDSDPIRFRLTANKQQVKPTEEIELTITAQYVNILPSQLFNLPGSNTFRLKLLLPEGFVQTGGDYTDYIGTELSSANPIITYILKGHFTRGVSQAQFRLLRGSAQATETSLFIEKAQVWIQIRPDIARPAAARQASDYANLSVNCDNSTLNVNGMLTTSNNQVGILLFKDGSIVSSAEVSTSFNQNFPLSGSGNYYAKVREMDLQQNTGQIFKQLVEIAGYNSRKGKDSLVPNASVGDCTKSRCTQRLPV